MSDLADPSIHDCAGDRVAQPLLAGERVIVPLTSAKARRAHR